MYRRQSLLVSHQQKKDCRNDLSLVLDSRDSRLALIKETQTVEKTKLQWWLRSQPELSVWSGFAAVL